MANSIPKLCEKPEQDSRPRNSRPKKAVTEATKNVQVKVARTQRRSRHTLAKPSLRTEISDEIVVVPRNLNSRFAKDSETVAKPQRSRLLSLPKELQIKIFHFALGTSAPHFFFGVCNGSLIYNTTRSAALKKTYRTPPLLLTSREVHEYATSIFYRDAVFHVHCYSDNDEDFRLMARQAAIIPLGRLSEGQILSRARVMHLSLHLEEVVDFQSYTHVVRRLVTAIGRGRSLHVLRICLLCDWDDMAALDKPTLGELRELLAALCSLACKGRVEVAAENPDLLVYPPKEVRVMTRELEEAIAG